MKEVESEARGNRCPNYIGRCKDFDVTLRDVESPQKLHYIDLS